MSQVAIAWLLHQPTVASVVIGARTMEQLEDNLNSVNVKLTKEEVCVHVIVCAYISDIYSFLICSWTN